MQEDNYEDIYDGSLYKKFMSSDGILADRKNLSLTWNVDGVPLCMADVLPYQWNCHISYEH